MITFGNYFLSYITFSSLVPRAATIQASTDGVLWALDRQTFRRIVLRNAFQKRKMYEALIENVPLLSALSVSIYFRNFSAPNFGTKLVDVWKFQDFSAMQNLLEINFAQSRGCKTAFFPILGALDFAILVNLSLEKVQKFIKINI